MGIQSRFACLRQLDGLLDLLEQDPRFSGLTLKDRYGLAASIVDANAKLISHIIVEAMQLCRADLTGELEVISQVASTLKLRAGNGQQFQRQLASLIRGLSVIGDFGRLALADAASGEEPLSHGMTQVSEAASVLRAATSWDVAPPSAVIQATAENLERWASLARQARVSMPKPMAQLSFFSRSYTATVLETVEEATGHGPPVGRATDTQTAAGQSGTYSLRFLEGCFHVIRRSLAAEPDDELRACANAAELRPNADTLIEWSYFSQGRPRQHRGKAAERRLRELWATSARVPAKFAPPGSDVSPGALMLRGDSPCALSPTALRAVPQRLSRKKPPPPY